MKIFLILCFSFIVGVWDISASTPTVTTSTPLLTVSAQPKFGKLYVSGQVLHPQASPSAHVDIALLDANDRVIAHKTESLRPAGRHPSLAESGRERFAVSFPSSDSRQAARVRVTLHNHSHRACEDTH